MQTLADGACADFELYPSTPPAATQPVSRPSHTFVPCPWRTMPHPTACWRRLDGARAIYRDVYSVEIGDDPRVVS